ncbi:hypothetical protein BJV74DRAFT_890236 [Russula compacta]|nr:hypothetical protein BJV74DRAFT_890236 [Russula compacta]
MRPSQLNFGQIYQGVTFSVGWLIASTYFTSSPGTPPLSTSGYPASGADDSWREDSFWGLPEITRGMLTCELAVSDGAAAADVGPFYERYHCIMGFVSQACYIPSTPHPY